MCSILADYTVEEMSQFFKDNGTRGEYIRENIAGAIAWGERMRSDFAIPQDQQPLELALRMCTIDPRKRPLAKELLSMIFDFDSPPRYYGLCCDEQCYSNEHSNDQILDVTPSTDEADLQSTSQGTNKIHEAKTVWPPRPRYQPPTVDDPTEETTVRKFFPLGGTAKKYILEDAEEPKGNVDIAASGGESICPALQESNPLSPPLPVIAGSLAGRTSPGSSLHSPLHKSSADDFLHSKPFVSILKNLDSSKLPCPWPTCSQLKFQNRESLVIHLRELHGTHELFWTPLLWTTSTVATTQIPDQWVPGQILSEPAASELSSTEKAFILIRDAASSTTNSDVFADRLRDQLRERRRLADEKSDPAHPGSKAIIDRSRHQPTNGRGTLEAIKSKSARFSLLPEGRRPEPLKPKSEDYEFTAEEEPVLGPDPLPEPFISSDPQRNNESLEFFIPRSSLVPSYFLAMSNRLTLNEIDSALASSALADRPPPLFVYGSLMFPSILRARAAKFTSAEGIYSRQLQRRLQTSAEDWSSVSESLQQAAQQMTPALLKGYQRLEIQESRDAALINVKSANSNHMPPKAQSGDSPNTNNTSASETKGFIIFGLSHEALACLDYLFSPEGHKELSATKSDGGKSNSTFANIGNGNDSDSNSGLSENYAFYRKKVEATVCASDGQPQTVEASTYIWQHGRPQRFSLWNLNKFVMCKSLRQFSTNSIAYDYDWVGEERLLAAKMGMMYAMLGDELCDKVLKNDVAGVDFLVAEGCDVNASCHNYGTPLQAAAAKGNENMVYVMMKFLHADPNIGGGKYRSPLVAAISEGHEDVVQTLLKYGANPLAEVGSYISPIYQAVSFGDVEMVRLLLEKGAWLSKNYQELLDLAAETGNGELCDVLREYDIRNLHKRKRLGEGGRAPRKSDNKHSSRLSDHQGLTDRRSYELMPALVEILQLQGQKGKWTGIKAIKVLRKAYADNVPEDLLDFIGEHLNDVQKILTDLVQGGTRERSLIKQGSEIGYAKKIKDAASSDDSAKPSSTPSTQRHPQHSHHESRAKKRESGDGHKEDDDAFCLTCGGRGGRKGTGRPCSDCRGSGSIERSPKADDYRRRRFNKCRACNGTGNIFSERNRCRVCNRVSWRYEEPARDRGGEYREQERESELKQQGRRLPVSDKGHKREYLDPPPPYPGRQ